MTPRRFLAADGAEPCKEEPCGEGDRDPGRTGSRAAGGEIFSNVKTGMVYPLIVELRHSWHSSAPCQTNGFMTPTALSTSN